MRKPSRVEIGLAAGMGVAGVAGEQIGHNRGSEEGVQRVKDKSYVESSRAKDAIAQYYPRLRDLGDRLSAFEGIKGLKNSLSADAWSERVDAFDAMIVKDLLPIAEQLIRSADDWRQTPAGDVIKGELGRALGMAKANASLLKETSDIPQPQLTRMGIDEDLKAADAIDTLDIRDLIPPNE